jgi:hypothetical protein
MNRKLYIREHNILARELKNPTIYDEEKTYDEIKDMKTFIEKYKNKEIDPLDAQMLYEYLEFSKQYTLPIKTKIEKVKFRTAIFRYKHKDFIRTSGLSNEFYDNVLKELSHMIPREPTKEELERLGFAFARFISENKKISPQSDYLDNCAFGMVSWKKQYSYWRLILEFWAMMYSLESLEYSETVKIEHKLCMHLKERELREIASEHLVDAVLKDDDDKFQRRFEIIKNGGNYSLLRYPANATKEEKDEIAEKFRKEVLEPRYNVDHKPIYDDIVDKDLL